MTAPEFDITSSFCSRYKRIVPSRDDNIICFRLFLTGILGMAANMLHRTIRNCFSYSFRVYPTERKKALHFDPRSISSGLSLIKDRDCLSWSLDKPNQFRSHRLNDDFKNFQPWKTKYSGNISRNSNFEILAANEGHEDEVPKGSGLSGNGFQRAVS